MGELEEFVPNSHCEPAGKPNKKKKARLEFKSAKKRF
jgi:hypothetical protein